MHKRSQVPSFLNYPFSRVTVSALVLLLSGCMTNLKPGSRSAVVSGTRISGSVHGGQQPVTGAQISLYAAGKTATGSASRMLLTAPVVTDSAGKFLITGLYSCQTGDQVYLLATGGNSGAGVNTAISMMTAVGACSGLQASTFVTINEVTTVASVYALAAFMTGPGNVGSDAAGANSLAAAFANVKTLVDTTTGTAPSLSRGNGIVPQTTVNSLANSLAACVNSTSGSTVCTNLFTATSAGGSTPADTTQAALNEAHNPNANPSQIYSVAGPNPPFQPTLTSAPASYAIAVAHPSDVLTYHNDVSRTGAQPFEASLTPANVNATGFGKRFSFPVDAFLFAQPLYVGGIGMADGAVHNVVYAATMHGTVYAFDGDGQNPPVGSLWQKTLIPSGEQAPVGADYGCFNPPEAGIIGTPVIDRGTMTLYVVVKTKSTGGGAFFQRLHAISLIDGSERPGSPSLINPRFTGSGAGSTGGVIAFNAQRQLNRAALLLTPNANGSKTVWVAYASHCDIGPYHGLVLGFDAANLTQQTASFNVTPNGGDGGIWMGGGGLAADPQGYVYASAANGLFDANTGGVDYGDSVLKLAAPMAGATSTGMKVFDYFTPSNQASLEQSDQDLGGAESLLFDDPASGVAPHLLVANDKNGTVYLIDTANMGKYATGSNGVDGKNGDVQDFNAGSTFINNFAFFDNVLYTSNLMTAYAFVPGTATTAGHFSTTPVGQSPISFSAPTVSANGRANTLVWVIDNNAVLRAYKAPELTEVYNSQQAPNYRDATAGVVKFTSPVIANGMVYVGGDNAVVAYGLLP